mgnify:CR=1 FL=1
MDAVIASRRIAGAGTPAAAWRGDPQLARVPVVAPAQLLAPYARIVVVAPHPDDEILACGGLLQAAAEHGLAHLLVAVTDGEASHPGSRDWPPARLRLERPRETLAALACLGIAQPAVLRLGFADGGVAACEDALAVRLGAILRPGDLLLTTWRYDAHPDHEACARACASSAAACGVSLLETPVWGWHWSAPGDGAMPLAQARKLALTPSMLARKRAALTCFHSQTGADGRSDGPVLPAQVIERLLHPFELVFHDTGPIPAAAAL